MSGMATTLPVSNIPLWGQAWELVVQSASGELFTISSNAWEPEALRVTFHVTQGIIGSDWWFADISIYNLTDALRDNLLLNATWARLKAGFQTGPTSMGVIWDGPVFQPTLERENVVDQKLTLHCLANPIAMSSIVNFAVGPFTSQQQALVRMADSIGLPPVDPSQGTQSQLAFQRMSAKQFPRGDTYFGKIGNYLQQMADDNSLQTWRDGAKAYVSEVGGTSDQDLRPNYVFAPQPDPGLNVPIPNGVTASIIGTPRQIPQGVLFTVLLDPRLRVGLPPIVAQIDYSTLITPLVFPTPSENSQLVTPYTANLKFFVASVEHFGDTRGNDWHTEVTGWSTTYASGLTFNEWSAVAQGG